MPSIHLADVLNELDYLTIVRYAGMTEGWRSNPYAHGAVIHKLIHQLYPVH